MKKIKFINNRFNGFGNVYLIYLSKENIGKIIIIDEKRSKFNYNEFHIYLEDNFQNKGYFEKILKNFLIFINKSVVIEKSKIININLKKAISKLNNYDFKMIENENYYEIKLN